MTLGMNRGITASSILHAILLAMLLIGMPTWLQPEKPIVPTVMVVEILPISDKTNVRASEPQPVKQPTKPEEKKPEPKKEEKKPEPKKEEPKPVEKKPEPIKPIKDEKKPEPKVEEKKPEPKKEEKKPKDAKAPDDFAEILKNLSKNAPPPSADNTNPNKAVNTQYDASQPMSVSEIDYMRQQIRSCWNVSALAGSMDGKSLKVTLKLQLLAGGVVGKVEVEDPSKLSDPKYNAAAAAAIRAVQRCSPFDKLPPEKYNSWKEMTMSFDPSEMLY
jgi:outer membrane biosynthesis protein TonB